MNSTVTAAQPCVSGRFDHRAVFYDGPDDFLAAVLPFVREGVRRGEPVLVALVRERLRAVEAALGADAARVQLADMGQLGGNPACIIPAWRRFLEEAGQEGPVRGVGEPIWSGRRDVEVEEAVLHEVLLNLAFDDGPGWQLMCPYDVTALPERVIDEARRSHPPVAEAVGYAGPHDALERFSAPLPAAPGHADAWDFGPEELPGLRGLVSRLATSAGVDRDRADDLVLATHELATNSITHGGGCGTLLTWADDEALVVEVRDTGRIADPLVGRDLAQEMAENGRGVWMANQLCDLVQVRSGPEGTTVRLFVWR